MIARIGGSMAPVIGAMGVQGPVASSERCTLAGFKGIMPHANTVSRFGRSMQLCPVVRSGSGCMVCLYVYICVCIIIIAACKQKCRAEISSVTGALPQVPRWGLGGFRGRGWPIGLVC